MSQVDVIIVVDTANLLATVNPSSTTENSPSQITNNTVYMLTNQNNVQSGQASAQLNLIVQPGDEIRWWATSLTLDTMFAVVIYDLPPPTGGPDLISPPQGQTLSLQAFTLNNPTSGPMQPQGINIYVWTANALSPGTVNQNINFVIINDQGQDIGYYYLDPLITIGSG